MKKVTLLTLVCTMLFWHGVSHAAQNEPTRKGRVDFINLKQSNIVVNDRSYTLATGYVIKDVKGKTISAFNLKKGQQIEVYTNDKRQVTEIVIVK